MKTTLFSGYKNYYEENKYFFYFFVSLNYISLNLEMIANGLPLIDISTNFQFLLLSLVAAGMLVFIPVAIIIFVVNSGTELFFSQRLISPNLFFQLILVSVSSYWAWSDLHLSQYLTLSRHEVYYEKNKKLYLLAKESDGSYYGYELNSSIKLNRLCPKLSVNADGVKLEIIKEASTSSGNMLPVLIHDPVAISDNKAEAMYLKICHIDSPNAVFSQMENELKKLEQTK